MPIRSASAAALLFAASLAAAEAQQTPTPGDEPEPVFGTTVVLPFGLRGEIYALKPWKPVEKSEKLQRLGTIYTSSLNIRQREFTQGFPGVTNRMEWFAIDYTGHFYVANPGAYEFMLTSDDGSMLYIDGSVVIDNQGLHTPLTKLGSVNLSGGVHRIRVPYFQGPRFQIALVLMVHGPGELLWRPFSTDDFKPPPHPEDWKFGSPDDLARDPLTPAEKKRGLFAR